MKKITAELGKANSELEFQLKETLNDISDAIENLIKEQFVKQYLNDSGSYFCSVCKKKAKIMMINIENCTHSFICDICTVPKTNE